MGAFWIAYSGGKERLRVEIRGKEQERNYDG